MISRKSFVCLVPLLLTLVPNLAAAELARPKADAPEVWARTELYFGTDRPGTDRSQPFAGDDTVDDDESASLGRFSHHTAAKV